MTLTPTTSPNSNSTPPSFDSASQVKEDSVGLVVPRKNGSNRPRTTRSIFGKLNIFMLNGSRQSIAEDAPNTASRSRRYRCGAASHHHPHTDTGFAFVKTSGAQSRLWTADDVLELTAPPLIQGVFLRVICKATRVMTSDPTSVLADQGHETGPLIGWLALKLVRNAHDEGWCSASRRGGMAGVATNDQGPGIPHKKQVGRNLLKVLPFLLLPSL
jgi:hypothetical protein